MQKVLVSVTILIFSFYSSIAQSLKVIGYPGDPYNLLTRFNDDYFTVERNDGYAIVNLEGKTIASGIKAPSIGFSRKLHVDYGTMLTQEGSNIVIKNIKGQPLGTGKYMDILPFTTDNTVARVPSPMGTWIVAYIDTLGREIVRFDVRKYISIVQPLSQSGGLSFISLSNFLPFSNGLTPIRSSLKNKYGFINKNLQLIIPVTFSRARPFSDGLAAVQNEDGNWGFIDLKGKLVIPYVYSREPSRFMSGLATVKNKDGLKGYINKANEVVIPPKYEDASAFYKGYALVREKYGTPALMIDSTGKIVTTFPKDLSYIDNATPPVGISGGDSPDYPFYISETLKQLVDEGKGIFSYGMSYGLVDRYGKIILECKYNHLSDYHNNKMFAYKSSFINNSTKEEYGILKDNGEWAIQIVSSEF